LQVPPFLRLAALAVVLALEPKLKAGFDFSFCSVALEAPMYLNADGRKKLQVSGWLISAMLIEINQIGRSSSQLAISIQPLARAQMRESNLAWRDRLALHVCAD
jgi:hypothetical protein